MRIRSIKPEFWRSDDVTSLPISARLTFIGMWSYVDDNGVGNAKLSSIIGDLYAEDMAGDPQETLQRVSCDLLQLENAGLLLKYKDPGHPNRELYFVTNWASHQLVNRPSKGHEYPLPSPETVAIKPNPDDTQANCMSVSGVSQETLSAGAGEQGSRGTVLKTLEQPAVARAPKAPNRFEEFWQAYPRKVDKKKAKDAFDVATKTVDPELIIAGAMRHAADPNRTDQFTKHPTTWLRAGSWDNDPLPPRNDSSESQAMKNARSIQQRFHQPQSLDEPWLIGGPNGNPERN